MKQFKSETIREFVTRPIFDEQIILNKDPSWPEMTIVTPSYNQAVFLERTILSVLNQNYPNFKYIIIDGGSDDGSVEIIKKYKKYLTFWISEKDKGQSDAINKGFLKSEEGILAWLNSDDVYVPGALISVGEFFKNHSEVDVLYGDAVQIDASDTIIKVVKDVPFSKNAFMYWGNDISQSSAFFGKEIFFNSGMLRDDLHYGMDYDLWFRLAKSGAKFVHISKTLAGARIHPLAKTVRTNVHHITPRLKFEILGIREKGIRYKSFYYLYRLRRLFLFLVQGDIPYIANRIIYRFKKHL